jgi:hypothetical protein
MKKPLRSFYIRLVKLFFLYTFAMVGISTVLEYFFSDTGFEEVPDRIGFAVIMSLFMLFVDRDDFLKNYKAIKGSEQSSILKSE